MANFTYVYKEKMPEIIDSKHLRKKVVTQLGAEPPPY